MRNTPGSEIQFARITSVEVVDGYVYISTQPPRPGVEYRNIPLLRLFPGAIVTPKEGDIVAVHSLSDGSRIATLASSTPQDFELPALDENELVFQFSDGTRLQISRDATETFQIDIEADGDVNVNAGGAVYINGTDFQQHTHNYEDDDGTTPTTKTTDPPN